jgi:hypothetical protein
MIKFSELTSLNKSTMIGVDFIRIEFEPSNKRLQLRNSE